MLHSRAVGMKTIFTTIILLSIFGIFQSFTITQILLMSLTITGVLYIIGDLVVLPTYGNFIAVLTDFGLSFIAIWALSSAFVGQSISIVLTSAGAAYFIAFCEAIFHLYMKERVLPKKRADIIPFPNVKLQTELSEEIYPETTDNQQKKK